MIPIINPGEIEKKSFAMITEILTDMGKNLDSRYEMVIKRVIHTTADFDYVDILSFTENVVAIIQAAIRAGAHIITDTNMGKAGINKGKLACYGGEVHCFMANEDVAEEARARGITRAMVSMERAAAMDVPVIFALGNAPTALIRLCEMISALEISPVAVIGVPVGFVNVVESKALLLQTVVPSITALGRKGGSNVAAAIINAILYSMEKAGI